MAIRYVDKSDINSVLGNAEIVIVGAGLFGLTIAEQAASKMGAKVAVIESRDHIGGNTYSYICDETGIEIHKYGSHIFHTSNKIVWDYVNQFTPFNNYIHKVYSVHKNKIFPMPVNLATICMFYEKFLNPAEAKKIIRSEADSYSNSEPANFEEKIITAVGKPLYDSLFRGYTIKQWQKDPKELPPEIAGRLPVRFSFNNNYFDDTWEGIPIKGYTGWISSMADNKNINVILDTDFFKIKNLIKQTSILVYTGPIDRYFEYNGGLLNWRTLDFRTEVKNLVDFQGTSVINFADEDVPYTRIHEFKHLHPERKVDSNKTVIMKEFSRKALETDEPYYPVNSVEDRKKLNYYREQIRALPKSVIFGGRLGSYLYLDMHMAIASALNTFETEVRPLLIENRSK